MRGWREVVGHSEEDCGVGAFYVWNPIIENVNYGDYISLKRK